MRHMRLVGAVALLGAIKIHMKKYDEIDRNFCCSESVVEGERLSENEEQR
jgi:hypothetical protein